MGLYAIWELNNVYPPVSTPVSYQFHRIFNKVAIEESNRRRVVLINFYPGMLLSDSLEPDVSHTSILYCYYTIWLAKINAFREKNERRFVSYSSFPFIFTAKPFCDAA
jgi:hypothetical protein